MPKFIKVSALYEAPEKILIDDIDLEEFVKSKTSVPGPYADDTAAGAAGVPIGGSYYKSTGVVSVRLT